MNNSGCESIFRSSLRSFFKTLFSILGIGIGVLIIAIIFFFFSSPYTPGDKTTVVIAPDAEGKKEQLPESTPVVLRINIHGIIGTYELNAKTIMTQLIDSRTGVLKKDRVKAILLHIDTPGGTAFDANTIYTHLMEYKKKYNIPIYVYVDGLCASGGMFIAAAADKIYSSPVGMIGSVGVILGPAFNFFELMEKVGVKALTLTEGKDKDILSPFRPWKPNEDASLKPILESDYERFVTILTESRSKLDKQKLIQEYGAHIFAPLKAEEIGYIDNGNSSYSDALTQLVKAANIEKQYQVIELKVVYPVLSNLIEGKSPLISGKITHELGHFPTALMNRSLYLYPPALQMISQGKSDP